MAPGQVARGDLSATPGDDCECLSVTGNGSIASRRESQTSPAMERELGVCRAIMRAAPVLASRVTKTIPMHAYVIHDAYCLPQIQWAQGIPCSCASRNMVDEYLKKTNFEGVFKKKHSER